MRSGADAGVRPGPVILIDDEEEVRAATGQALELEGLKVTGFARADRALERLGRDFAGAVVSDIRMPHMDGMTLLGRARDLDPELPVILMTGHGDVPLAVEAMRTGAYDFIEKPFAPSRLVETVLRALDRRRLVLENRALRTRLEGRDRLEATLVGRSPAMAALRERLRAVAAADVDLLILGETGTGKSVAARAVHDLSDRRDRPFVALDVAALPATTIESELFGHEAGAFAGAHRARVGKFEHARGGTLFLDEIGAVPPGLQAKLLRVIEDRAIVRLGSNEPAPLDVRFIAASKEDLAAEAAAGRFRDDLFYRLNVASIVMPALEDRIEDAPLLFHHLVGEAALRWRRAAPEVTAEALAAIATRRWPGNVRELRNAADRFVLGLGLDPADAPAAEPTLAARVDRFEKSLIAAALAANRGALKPTYAALGLSRKTLYEKMQRHRLRREDFAGGGED